jgi:phosphoglycolate phosphatase-like HAD superfamily hydrolase
MCTGVVLFECLDDIQSAAQAGVEVIAFRTGGFSDEHLSGAIAIYDDSADLLKH